MDDVVDGWRVSMVARRGARVSVVYALGKKRLNGNFHFQTKRVVVSAEIIRNTPSHPYAALPPHQHARRTTRRSVQELDAIDMVVLRVNDGGVILLAWAESLPGRGRFSESLYNEDGDGVIDAKDTAALFPADLFPAATARYAYWYTHACCSIWL